MSLLWPYPAVTLPSDVLDATENHIRNLVPPVGKAAYEIVFAARTAGLPLIITSSTRSRIEQAGLVRAGFSKNLNSLHLQGRAFDVDLWGWDRDDVPAYVWKWLGPLGESFGLKWGGRFKSIYDPGHFEK